MSKPQADDRAQLHLGEVYRNCGLFADHFLKDKLPGEREWQSAEGADGAFETVKRLYREGTQHFTASTDEAPTESDLIRPLLDALWGHDRYRVQPPLSGADAWGVPDYAFFLTADDRNSAEARVKTPEYWRDVACLGDAKRWAGSLDREAGARSPSAQIANYLYRSGVRWGILTNGRVWRLYEQDRSRAGGTFFEADLEEVVRRDDCEAFRWFWLFFRPEAFVPHDDGKTFLDKVFDGSIEYATEVGDRLKDSVYDALRSLVNGFCEWPANGLDPRDPDTLRLVHDNALIVLYRVLFALFAEDRKLLPCDDEQYGEYCLRRVHRRVNRQLRQGHSHPDGTRGLWNALCENWRLIDEGLRDGQRVVVPAYNGGLFSPQRYPEIAHTPSAGALRWEAGDRRVAQVIDLLSYERDRWDKPGERDIDYGTLAVQHLGSIYEGLLELQPQVADEDKIETTEKGRPVYKPAAEVPNPKPVKGQPPRRVAPGEVYPVTNRGERKATGSYYTPSYIVDYIVEHTVGPLADEAAKRTAEMAERASELAKRLNKANGKAKVAERAEWDGLQRRWLEPYLSLRILDPAMGSGHFLVGAADFLSMAMANDESLAELQNGHEDPQAYYKRLVVERCLYGVDLNPLAVELAKLSLWLHTVSRDKALSFLDHHLRCGNSLIGARIEEDLSREPPRFTAKGKRVSDDGAQLVLGFTQALAGPTLQHLLSTLGQITQGPSGSADSEKAKELLYKDVERVRGRFRKVANCWLAPYFGATVTPEQYGQAVEALKQPEKWEALEGEEWFGAAQKVADDRRFFHWELEFPECFFGPAGLKTKEERGFEAVIGNPPYMGVRTGQMPVADGAYLGDRYVLAKGQWDLFAVMAERGFWATRGAAYWGNIIPRRSLQNESFAGFRQMALVERSASCVMDAGKVFEDPNVEACVVCLRALAAGPESAFGVDRLAGTQPVRLGAVRVEDMKRLPFGVVPLGATPQAVALAARLAGLDTTLGRLAEITRGIEAGLNDPSTCREPRPGAEPLVTGEDVQRHSVRFSGWYVVPDNGDLAKFKAPSLYHTVPKILVRFVASGLVSAVDREGYYNHNVLYNVHTSQNSFWLTALLDSRLLDWWFRLAFQSEEGIFPHIQKSQLVQVPSMPHR